MPLHRYKSIQKNINVKSKLNIRSTRESKQASAKTLQILVQYIYTKRIWL